MRLEDAVSGTADSPEQDSEEEETPTRGSARARFRARIGTTAFGRVVLRIVKALVDIEVFDRSMTLAAQAFTSILPLVIAAVALRNGGAKPVGAGLSGFLGLPSSAEEVLEGVVPESSDIFSSLSWFGFLILIVSATAYSRALDRFYARVWSTRKPGIRVAWRWLVVLAAILIGLALVQFTRSIVLTDDALTVLAFLLDLVGWTAVWLLAGWIMLNRAISFRLLLPGAVLTGLGLAIAGSLARIYLPRALTSAAEQFGALGITIAYIGWLFIVMAIVVVGVTIGKVLAIDYRVMGKNSLRGYPSGGSGATIRPSTKSLDA